jgi:hypothetical protein
MSTKTTQLDWREGRRRRAWELKEHGWKQQDSAAALGVTPGAVSQWLKRGREQGVEGLRRHPAPGRQPRLTPEQLAEQGIALAIQAMLVSPHFLFHIERDPFPTDPNIVHRISDLELASRLSYFLWNSMPDEQLLSLAERKRLSVPSVLDAQVTRMLADPKASAMAENFAGQWLEVRNLDAIKPDPQKFPDWTPDLRDALKTETRMFFDAILRENRPIGEFITARYTFLNEFLAKYYGIDGVTGPEFRRVNLTTDQRGGVLTHGSVLAVSSYPTRTSVVIRGKYILQNILGTPPPPPPANVPALEQTGLEVLPTRTIYTAPTTPL